MTWKPIAGYEGLYEVSDVGTVRCRKSDHYRLMKLKYNRFTGYYAVDLRKDGKCKTFSVHRLVATAFLPNPDGLPYVNHKDEDKTNNCVSNLEWCTSEYNNLYSSYKRRKKVEAYTVDGELLATFESVDTAAQMLGVTKSAVSQAANGIHGTCLGLVLKTKE